MTKRRSKGEGSIYFDKRSNRWVAQITLPNGQRKGKSAKNQKEVRDWLLDQRKNVKEGLYIVDDQIKVGEYLDQYMENVAGHQLRLRTLESHSGYVRNHLKPELGNIKLNQLRPD